MSFAVAQYRTAGVQTATPVQIVVKLYDGALRFLEQAKGAIADNNFPLRGQSLRKAHAVVSELQSTLNPDHAPELCQELDRLYEFVLHRITRCSVSGQASDLEAPMSVLEQLRGAWAELAKQS